MLTWANLFIFGLLVSLGACSVVLGWLKQRAIIDLPNERSSHSVPTPRGGGIGVLIPVFLSLGFLLMDQTLRPGVLVVGVCGLLLAIVSFLDDLSGLSARVRFLAHFGSSLATVLVLEWGGRGGHDFYLWLLGMFVSVFWITGYTNAFNFMDGINGIAGGQAAVTGIGTALIGMWSGLPATHPAVALALVISGGALGFLPYNFPRARMFMGDAGSATIGYLLATLAVWVVVSGGAGWFLPLVALHLNFGMDTGITLFRRIVRGERWQEPHREHFYQLLVRSGYSHASVTGAEMFIQLLVVGSIPLALPFGTFGLILHFLGWAVVWGCFFMASEFVFRRHVTLA